MSIPAFIEASKEVMPKISLVTDYGEESTYAIARLLMRFSRWILDILHMSHSTDAFVAVYSIVVFGVAFGLGWLIKALMVLALRHIKFKAPQSLYNLLLERHFFIKICRIIPPFVFLILIQFTLYEHVTIATWLTRLSWVYVVIIFTYSMCTLADCIWLHLDQRENTRRLPLKGIVQIIKIFLWIMATIIVTAVLINKSPATLLAGLGAFAAVLMLIFKDSILGVVAGVQLAQNDSLHVGDWIAVPNSNANGTVSEVSLTAVKIVNWDLTVTTVAPYNLITNGFTNYRNMQQSNTRRIQRSYMIDADSVDGGLDRRQDKATRRRQNRGCEEQRRTGRRNHRHELGHVPGLHGDVAAEESQHIADQRPVRHHTRTDRRRDSVTDILFHLHLLVDSIRRNHGLRLRAHRRHDV